MGYLEVQELNRLLEQFNEAVADGQATQHFTQPIPAPGLDELEPTAEAEPGLAPEPAAAEAEPDGMDLYGTEEEAAGSRGQAGEPWRPVLGLYDVGEGPPETLLEAEQVSHHLSRQLAKVLGQWHDVVSGGEPEEAPDDEQAEHAAAELAEELEMMKDTMIGRLQHLVAQIGMPEGGGDINDPSLSAAESIEERMAKLAEKINADKWAPVDPCDVAQAAGRNDHVTLVRMITGDGYKPCGVEDMVCRIYEWQSTSLMLAAAGGGVDCLRLLLDRGADIAINYRDADGLSAVMVRRPTLI